MKLSVTWAPQQKCTCKTENLSKLTIQMLEGRRDKLINIAETVHDKADEMIEMNEDMQHNKGYLQRMAQLSLSPAILKWPNGHVCSLRRGQQDCSQEHLQVEQTLEKPFFIQTRPDTSSITGIGRQRCLR
jgi:hypothetical protein